MTGYSIGITTFSNRFHLLAQLVQDIRKQRDEVPILLAINGNFDGTLDNDYRIKILNLCSSYKNIYPIMFLNIRGFSKLVNTLVVHSPTDHLLFFSDDIEITNDRAFDDFEKILEANANDLMFKLQHDFSQVVFTKRGMIDINWMDERFLAFGLEDWDFYNRHLEKYHNPMKYDCVDGFRHTNSSILDDNFDLGDARCFKTSPINRYVYETKEQDKTIISEKQYPYEQFYLENKHKISKYNETIQ